MCSFFYIVLLLCISLECFSLPHCCHRLYYPDLFIVCGISLCKLSGKFLGNTYFSCISKGSANIQNITNISPQTFGISKLPELCQILNRLESGLATWSLLENSPCMLLIEVRNNSSQNWNLASLPATISGLLFEKNYTLAITPLVPNTTGKVVSAIPWFITLPYLDVFKTNFSICVPGPSLNISAFWNFKEETVKWLPKNTTFNNFILGYNISVFSDGMVLGNLYVNKDSLKAFFTHLNFSANYVFAVKAVTEEEMGKLAVTGIDLKELKILNTASYPYHYMVSSLLFLLLIVVFATLVKVHKKVFKRKAYPSGVADVDDHIRPLLISSDKIHLGEVLGKGAFGVVHKGIYARSKSKEEVAVKVFPSETNTRHQLLQEVEIMCLVGRHDRVVGLLGISLEIEKMYLILEYCPLGDLQSYLVKLKPEVLRLKRLVKQKEYSMNEKDKDHGKRLCSYIYQVAQGMEYIASLRLIHRDLAARNILMLTEKRVKIADFGLSKDVYENEVYAGCKQRKLPLKWMAPESIEKQTFTTYTDVWSFGILMWEVFKLGKEPYPGLTNSRLLEYLKLGYRLEKPHCNEEWYKLMLKCWRQNPRERPQFKQLVKQIGVMIDKMLIYSSVV